MRNRLWALIVDVKIAERYYWHYISISKRYDKAISAMTLFASAASIYTWYIWEKFPVVWAIIAGTAQVISTFQPLFSFSKRVNAATYVQQDLQKLLIDMEDAWAHYEQGISDDQALAQLTAFKRRFAETEDRFAPPELFPQNRRIHDRAQKEAQAYFISNYEYSKADIGGD